MEFPDQNPRPNDLLGYTDEKERETYNEMQELRLTLNIKFMAVGFLIIVLGTVGYILFTHLY